jgi:hypothetical protein
MQNRNVWVYDIETLASCFTYTALNIDTQEIVQYVLHKDRWDYNDLIIHLKSCKGHIGFNNVNFDYPIIHFILKSINKDSSKEFIIREIHNEATSIIEEQNQKNFVTSVSIKEREVLIPQLDLFKIWHYNNKARSTSLKALEISMNFLNVMEMPIDHTKTDININEVPSILEYNLNDVLATYEFYKKSLDKIQLRKSLMNQFKIPCINWSDSRIGEQLILKLYCDKTNSNPWDIKKMRTHRDSIDLNECILPYIKFKSNEFTNLLNKLKSKVIRETKGSISESVLYKGFKYDYGTGGIHGCIKAGVYESSEDYIIIDADVASLYPSLSITNGFYIEHLGKDFVEVYQSIINMRIEAKKAKNMVLSDGFKLAANSVYGKSNDINSFLYDPKFTMCITLNGQLLLTMLAEELVDRIKDITVLQINTDGITLKIPKNQYSINAYYNICKEWESKTKLVLEYAEYSKMIIADVNNYIAVKTDGKLKHKGRFEVDKVVGSEPAYHKDNSFRIVPLALQEYFVNNIPIKDTIMNHINIYDFCGRQKFGRDSYGQTFHIEYDENKKPYEKTVLEQKNTRYYISNKGATFIKYYNKGTSECIHVGQRVTVFNKFINKPINEYDINYRFYISEAQKEIDNIIDKQLKLFN